MSAHRCRSAVAVVVLFIATPAVAAESPLFSQPQLTSSTSLTHPILVSAPETRGAEPMWTHDGLWTARPRQLHGLAQVAQAGFATYDPSTRAFYATADGCLVRVEPDGKLPVVLCGVQGIDIDVRGAAGIAIAREPDHTIVRWQWRDSEVRRQVLLRGPHFFNPRLSPDGKQLLVAESRAGGGHIWLISGDAPPVDLGQGYGATWHPGGQRILFTRIVDDGRTVRSSTLLLLDVTSRLEQRLAQTDSPPVTRPAISPDGASMAFVDGRTGAVMVAPLPLPPAERR